MRNSSPRIASPMAEEARFEHEVRVRADLNSGKSLSEIFNIRSILDAAGVEEFDCTWRG